MCIKCISCHSFTSRLISHRYFGSRRQWDCRGASNLEDLHQRLSQVMIRRLKAEVLTQLPPKVRQRIPFDLPKEAAKVHSWAWSPNVSFSIQQCKTQEHSVYNQEILTFEKQEVANVWHLCFKIDSNY